MLPYVAMILCFRMWTLPEASEIARPNANVEEGNVPVAAECGSKKVGCFFLPLLIPPRIPKAATRSFIHAFLLLLEQLPQQVSVIKFSTLRLIQCHTWNH
jgi:hypothetical protein